MKKFIALAILLSALVCCKTRNPDERPNILLIVADDLGYSDIGCYGGDIRTPNIDLLAQNGLRFSRFHTSPLCAPTRAMILTGQNNHVAGMGSQGGVRPSSPVYGQPGYEAHLSDRVVPVPALLKEAGYHTYIAGKWHLGKREEDSPKSKGFERSFNLLQGAGNHFNNIGIEANDTLSAYRQDGALVDYPDGKYSTELYTDKLMEFIKGDAGSGKPFFAFAAYTSPHWPLQVPDDYLNKYRGAYDMGYDSLRVLRFESLKRVGMIPPDAVLPPRLASITPWQNLTTEEQKIEARKMELYAAMVENLDYHIGRLLEFLKDENLYDNTIVIFLSDNGAAPNDFYNEDWSKDFLRKKYDNSYENMGKVSSFVSYGPQWAQAGAAPFNRFKGYTTEGGMNTPFIISGKGIPSSKEIRDVYFTLVDLAPTFYDWAGIQYPGTLGTEKTRPLLGASIAPYLMSQQSFIHDEQYGFGLEHGNRSFYRKGDWKIVMLNEPYVEENMQLFNIANDLGETEDLSKAQPQKFRELLDDWQQFIAENNIIISR